MPPARLFIALLAIATAPAGATGFQVRLEATTGGSVSGRLLVLAQRADPAATDAPTRIDIESFSPPRDLAVAARDVNGAARGDTLRIDADDLAWPAAFARLPPGDYWVQALLDTRRDYGHFGRGGGDLTGPVRRVRLGPGQEGGELELDRVVPAVAPWSFAPGTARFILAAAPHARANARPYRFVSPSISAFTGRTIEQRGWVLLPPGYGAGRRYSTVYSLSTYSGDMARSTFDVTLIDLLMSRGDLPPMVWVFPDYATHGGTHQFADSVNNGPWGHAFVQELVPWIASHYAVDDAPRSRLLTGHSSGGWASLWLQVTYPEQFGGAWSTGPDPIDFHDFLNVDIYATHANAYVRSDGSRTPAARSKGQVVAHLDDVARIERVLGDTGGQLGAFEWTFSPRGDDGRPLPLFDRRDGTVDPMVAAAWRRYDIVDLLRGRRDPALARRLHVIVGADDNYYLDGPVRRLAAGQGLADVRILPSRDHNNLHKVGDDPLGLFRTLGREMRDATHP